MLQPVAATSLKIWQHELCRLIALIHIDLGHIRCWQQLCDALQFVFHSG